MFGSVPRRVLAVIAAAAAIAAVLTVADQQAGAATVSGTYHSVSPARVLDTRTGTGAPVGAVAGGQDVTLSLAGVAGLPGAGAFSAVQLNVAVTAPGAGGYITVYPDGQTRPATANLNFSAGQTLQNSVFARVATDGKIKLHNGSLRSVQLIADIRGYYTGSDAPSGRGAVGALTSSVRVLDTRTGTGAPKAAVAGHRSVTTVVTGNGVPASASAVVLNVTAVGPTRSGNLTVYPAGSALPNASTINFAAGDILSNLVVVPVGSGGAVTLYNNSIGTVQMVADIFGYYTNGLPSSAGAFNPLPPSRVLDTRTGNGGYTTPFPANGTRTVTVAGRGGVPRAGVDSVIVNLTVVAPVAAGYLTIYAGTTRPAVANLNFAAGQTIANLAVTGVAANGTITIVNSSLRTANVLVDVAGYTLATDRPVPTVSSVSRYVRNLDATATDATTMHNEGCADSTAGSTLVLLDIGAQSESTSTTGAGDVLGPNNPGVALSATNPVVRLTYSHLVTALDNYTAGFVACSGTSATILIGTNNDGDFTGYTATAKGADWANLVIDKLTQHSPQLTIAAADDIEAGFASTAAQASTWETSYLASTTANLVYAGSLDACPTTFGSTADCGTVAGQSGTWTRTNYAALTHGNSPTRISVLPQVYDDAQAVQWANIDVTAGGGITFIGALTENAACGSACSNDSVEGWTALYAAISTVVTSPAIPARTDLMIS